MDDDNKKWRTGEELEARGGGAFGPDSTLLERDWRLNRL